MLVMALFYVYPMGSSEQTAGSTAADYTQYEYLASLMEKKEQGKDFFLIDVRTPAEYAEGHIPTAFLAPLQDLENTMPTQDKGALIILYCRTGNRSGAAQRLLESKGYTNVHNFGGYRKWKGQLATGD